MDDGPTPRRRKVRVLVIGDSGVGKTTWTRALCGGAGAMPASTPGRTSGCRVEVMYADAATDDGAGGGDDAYFVELWDVGGHRQYARERGIFYDQMNGVIIVHDATSRTSGARCERWAREVAARGTFSAPTATGDARDADATEDASCVMHGFGGLPVPCLIVANKVDLEERDANDGVGRRDGIARRARACFGGKRRRSILPETVVDAARAASAHRRQPSLGERAFARLPPGGGLRTSARLGRVHVDVVRGFFRELVRRRYDAAVIDAGASNASERLLRAAPVALADDDLDDLT
jgi:Rab-like protein 3